MKAVYTLPVRSGLVLPISESALPLEIGSGNISWTTDEHENLAAMKIEFHGLNICYTDEGRIDPAPVFLRTQAFRIASYIANRVYLQTSIDAVDPDGVLMASPQVFPENQEEEDLFGRIPRRIWVSVLVGFSIRGELDPGLFPQGFKQSAAYGHYADAKRINNPFQKFELFF